MNNQYVTPTKVHGFRFWCQKVIPLVFDDSLSYYEVLCKLTHFMNEFSESLNQTIDGLLELQEYFDELKEDVNKTLEDIIKLAYNLNGCYRLQIKATSILPMGIVSEEEKESLRTILNNMITENEVKPIYLDIINDTTGTSAINNKVDTYLIHPNNMFINYVKNNYVADIQLYSSVIVSGTSFNENNSLVMVVNNYTIENGLIKEINHVAINKVNKAFLPLDGSFEFTPTSDNQPATKGYVDSHSGGDVEFPNISEGSKTLFDSYSLDTSPASWTPFIQDCYDNKKPIPIITFDGGMPGQMGYIGRTGIIVGGEDTIDLQTKPTTIRLKFMSIYAEPNGPKLGSGAIDVSMTWNGDTVTVNQVALINASHVDLYSASYIDNNISGGLKAFNKNYLNTTGTEQTNFINYLNSMLNDMSKISPFIVYDDSSYVDKCYVLIPENLNDVLNNPGYQGFSFTIGGVPYNSYRIDVFNIYRMELVVNLDSNSNITDIVDVRFTTDSPQIITENNISGYLPRYFQFISETATTMDAGAVFSVSTDNLGYSNINEWTIVDLKAFRYIPNNTPEYIPIDPSDYTWSESADSNNPEGKLNFSLASDPQQPSTSCYLCIRIEIQKVKESYSVSWM